jgi:DNA-binding CsgD family transcriptional regulator
MPGLRHDFGSKADRPNGAVSPMWKLHAALAHCWAGELEASEVLAASLEATPDLSWGAGASGWIRGLIAERKGDPAAVPLLVAALAAGTAPLPVFSAHLAVDLARVADAAGDAATSLRASTHAAATYRAIGAVPYLTAPTAVSGPSGTSGTAVPVEVAGVRTAIPGVSAALSEREQDVVTLVVRGMSYAQIARELFITRSTVGFHLSRIYAKTGTSTRHELSELIQQR